MKKRTFLYSAGIVCAVLLIILGFAWWYSSRSPLHLTPEEQEWLKQHPTIRIAPNPNFIPIEFFEGDTAYSGLAADLVKEIERELGITFTVVRYNNMAEIFDAAERKDVDVITATAITEKRKKYLLFTDPFIHLQKVIVVRKSDKRSLTIDSLNGMHVAVIYHSSVHERLLNEGVKAILDTVPSTIESLYEVSFGKVDASVANIATVSYIIEKQGLSNLRIAGDFGPKDPYMMAVRNDWPELVSILNKAMASIPPAKMQQFIKKWTGLELAVPWYFEISWQWIVSAVILLALFTGIVLLWNRLLSRKLKEKSEELEQEFLKRLETQNELLKSEEKFHTLFMASADANLIIMNNVFVDCNDAAARSLETERANIIGKRLDEISPTFQPDGVASSIKYSQFYQRAIDSGAITFEWMLQKVTGQIVWVEITMSRVTIDSSIALFTSWRDITDRKLVEQETYNHFKQLQTLYNASQSIAQSISTQQVGVKAIEALNFLFPSKESCIWIYHLEHDSFELLSHSKDGHTIDSETLQPISLTQNSLCRWVLNNGESILSGNIQSDPRRFQVDSAVHSVLCVPLKLSEQVLGCVTVKSTEENAFNEQELQLLSTLANSVAIVLENVRLIESLKNELAERKRIKEHQQKLEEQLYQIQKMESLGTLAGGVAHDFNNILGIISAYTEMLVIHKNDEARFQKYIEAITQTTTRATNLVRQILTFARRTELQQVPVNINDLIKELTKLLSETLPKTIEIQLELQPNLSPILGDPTQIHQALLNLSLNARDAMPNGGTLYLKTELLPLDDVKTTFPKAQATSYVVITIRDTGIGMSQELLKRIYEPFYTTKENGKGTGLGLSVVYGVVSSLNGFIDVKSTVGQGTTFQIFLPSNHTIQKSDQTKITIPTIKDGNETILIIEDEDFLRELLVSVLENHGYKALIAKDGLEGVDIYKENYASIDLVLSDLGLPKLSGTESLIIMKRIKPTQKVIMASGYFDPDERKKISELGVTHFLQKPYNPSYLLQIIRTVLDGTDLQQN
jgi:PAS domain S-box-containing protein